MRPVLLLFLLCAASLAMSQDSSFHIKDYKFRTPGFRALSLDLNVSGNYSNRSVDNNQVGRHNNTSVGPLGATFYQIRSTENRFQQNTISFSTNFDRKNRKEGLEKENWKRFSNEFRWSYRSRTYRSNQWFFEVGNDLQASHSSANDETPTTRIERNFGRASNTVTLGVGRGRIEWVQDAQMAQYILQDLAGQDLLDRQPTAEESNDFARLITDINNQRVFDNRRRRIYELSRIDSFLRNNKLVLQPDIRHFATVNDNWAFSITPFRQSGSSWFARLMPGASIERNNSENNFQSLPAAFQSTMHTFYFTPELGYENFKPISLKWQRNFGISVAYFGQQYNRKSKSSTSTGLIQTTEGQYGGMGILNAFYSLGYFPNTRTQLTADLGVWGSLSGKYWNAQPSLNIQANYFLGYRTFLTGQAAIYSFQNEYDIGTRISQTDAFSSSFSIRLSHFLF